MPSVDPDDKSSAQPEEDAPAPAGEETKAKGKEADRSGDDSGEESPKPPTKPAPAPTPEGALARQVRSLRRWNAFFALVALAAAGVGGYALLLAGNAADRDDVTVLERKLKASDANQQKQLKALIDQQADTEEQLGKASNDQDLARLERQVTRLERRVSSAVDEKADDVDMLSRLSGQVDRLGSRLDSAEQTLQQQADDNKP